MELRPLEVLGLRPGATQQEIRAAYRSLVKTCHPDQFQDPEVQKLAQEKLIRLNLAYEEALRMAENRRVGFNKLSCEDAIHFASRLLEQDNPESALRQLARAETHTAEWFCLQGDILMRLKQFETAHQSYREAVNREPDNRRYREKALDAALAMKKANSIGEKLFGWMKHK